VGVAAACHCGGAVQGGRCVHFGRVDQRGWSLMDGAPKIYGPGLKGTPPQGLSWLVPGCSKPFSRHAKSVCRSLCPSTPNFVDGWKRITPVPVVSRWPVLNSYDLREYPQNSLGAAITCSHLFRWRVPEHAHANCSNNPHGDSLQRSAWSTAL